MRYPWFYFFLRGLFGLRDIVWPEGLCQWKTPVTSTRIEPATFPLVAQNPAKMVQIYMIRLLIVSLISLNIKHVNLSQ
jgi:hypothetical protein